MRGYIFVFAIAIMTLPVSSYAVDCYSCSECSNLLNAGYDATLKADIYDNSSSPGACIMVNDQDAEGTTFSCGSAKAGRRKIVGRAATRRSGIKVTGVNDVEIKYCDVRNYDTWAHAPSYYHADIILQNSWYSEVHHNTVIQGRQGIVISGTNSQHNQIHDNVVQHTIWVGIAVWDQNPADGFDVTNNEINANILHWNYNGLSPCHHSTGNVFEGNQVYFSESIGTCFCSGAEYTTYNSNTTYGSEYWDILLAGGEGNNPPGFSYDAAGPGNSGTNNSCDNDKNWRWDDTGTTGCTVGF